MDDCLFCRIRDKKIASESVYEDEQTLAFLDIMPRSPGHTVVISKVHSETLVDLPDAELLPLALTIKRMAGALPKALGADGLTVGINHGAVSGQTVQHLHVHLLPRFKDDGGGSIHTVVHNPPKQTIEEIAEKIRKVL